MDRMVYHMMVVMTDRVVYGVMHGSVGLCRHRYSGHSY